MRPLKEIYNIPDKIVATAHRGFSGKYPENTLLAFEEAVKIGVDIVEFDVRASKDNIPVILHDKTLERTTDGTGAPENLSLRDLKKLNASFWEGCHDNGIRLDKPKVKNSRIPSLKETFELLKDKVYMNIQVYADSLEVRENICELFDEYDLYEQAFLMIPLFSDIKKYRKINPDIELCVGEDRTNLPRHKAAGLNFIQPYYRDITPDFCKKIEELSLCANMFFSNTAKNNKKYISYGIKGIMTDFPDILINA